jgi:hypothetical protein
MGAPTDHTSKPPPSTAVLCFLEPDPLALAKCVGVGPPALVVSFDPMLEEITAALVMSLSLEAASLGIVEPSPAVAVQELPQLTPPRVGQLNVEDGDTTPTPCEAAQGLARFTEEVQCKRQSPLIASPRRQKAVTKRPLPIRSKWIATQPLSHVPISKRGEVLLR